MGDGCPERVELRHEGFSTVGVQALACLFDAQTQAKAWTPARQSHSCLPALSPKKIGD